MVTIQYKKLGTNKFNAYLDLNDDSVELIALTHLHTLLDAKLSPCHYWFEFYCCFYVNCDFTPTTYSCKKIIPYSL